MNILFTGASSFTGFTFVQKLIEQGHKVFATITQPGINDYDGLKRTRLELLNNNCNWIANTVFGDQSFIRCIQENFIEVICHHGANVSNYKSEDFNYVKALKTNTHNIQSVLEAFKEQDGKAFIFTGSAFENNEGDGGENSNAFSPYGLSKSLSYETIKYFCYRMDVPLGKFVIPNPFGAFEEERFTNYLMKTWVAGNIPKINTPDYIRDNIHIDLLAQCYAKFISEISDSHNNRQLNPSQYAFSQGEFAKLFAKEMAVRTRLTCEVNLAIQKDFTEPLKRVNTDVATNYVDGWDESDSWDNIAQYYLSKFQLSKIRQ